MAWWWILGLALAADPVDGTGAEGAEQAAVSEVAAAEGPEDILRQVFAEVERLSGVEVRVASGVVHLGGSVPSVRARDEAHALAEGLEGVRFVDNQIAVLEGEVDRSGDSLDATLEGTLHATFGEIEGLERVEVSVNAGVVRLTGQVVEGSAREVAVALAEQLEGVAFVDDRIRDSTAVDERLAPALAKSTERVQELVARLPLLAVGGVVLGLVWLLARMLSSWDAPYRRVQHRPLLRAMLGRLVRGLVLLVGALIALEIVGASGLIGALVGTAGMVGIAVGFGEADEAPRPVSAEAPLDVSVIDDLQSQVDQTRTLEGGGDLLE